MNLQSLLNKWKIKADINILLGMWNESHRSYHNLGHLSQISEEIENLYNQKKVTEKEYEKLMICAVFHDIVYDPAKTNNEEMSADFFISLCQNKDNSDIQDIKQAILETKTHKPTTALSEKFSKIDMAIVEGNLESLLEWERGIQDEFIPVHGKDAYKQGRIKFLESLLDKYNHNANNLLQLITFVKGM